MADYYSILGINKTASDSEIKSAFRKLAKVYHPDKNPNNPNANFLFSQVLKAYTILINPVSRSRYDNGLPEIKNTQPRRKKNTEKKEWTFTEEDLKRRQYYQNYYKTKQTTENKSSTKTTTYSDYKYILFATPLAVGLLMLIVSMFTETPTIQKKVPYNLINEQQKLSSEKLVTGNQPYIKYFGVAQLFPTQNKLQVSNPSSYDAVVVLFDIETHAYLRHAYIESSFFMEFSLLPQKGVYWKCMLGENWNKKKPILNTQITGLFDTIVQFQDQENNPIVFNQASNKQLIEINFIESQSKNKQYISNATHFFEK